MREKIFLHKLTKEESEARAGSKDAIRNALGYVEKEEIEQIIEKIIDRLSHIGVVSNKGNKKYHDFTSYRIDISCGELFREIDDLRSNKASKGQPIGLFFEPLSFYEDNKRIVDNSRYGVYVYFTVSSKALTRFRRFLMKDVFVLI